MGKLTAEGSWVYQVGLPGGAWVLAPHSVFLQVLTKHVWDACVKPEFTSIL